MSSQSSVRYDLLLSAASALVAASVTYTLITLRSSEPKPAPTQTQNRENGKEQMAATQNLEPKNSASSRETTSNLEQKYNAGQYQLQKERIVRLYEEYIHLPILRQVWSSPVTEKPDLEPCFAAGFHGIELCFLLLAEIVLDDREYISKRPRIEAIATEISKQCELLVDFVDGELEDRDVTIISSSLTQNFPFEACPPTKFQSSHSPCLQRVIDAVEAKASSLSTADLNSLCKVIRNITKSFESSFSQWTVGLGIEPQLQNLRTVVGLSRSSGLVSKPRCLDYAKLVKSHLVDATFSAENYVHKEDFFFRTVHLGTECWGQIAIRRLNEAKRLASETPKPRWHDAATRIRQAVRILAYLGDHVLMLTSMNLRDYLLLKVELEGTSGAGSIVVASFRDTVRSMFDPLHKAIVGNSKNFTDEMLKAALLRIYMNPDRHVGMYDYAKSLEDLESGLLGGFFFKHFLLATNVIGFGARGTMQKMVSALKNTYERQVFPELDAVRCRLGQVMDEFNVDRKGKLLDEIEARGTSFYEDNNNNNSKQQHDASSPTTASAPSTLPNSVFEGAWQHLYATDSVPIEMQQAAAKEMQSYPKTQFLDHAWGHIAPQAAVFAMLRYYGLQQLGNNSWNIIFGDIFPQAANIIRSMLGLNANQSSIEFGHNSHELVWRMLSERLDPLLADHHGAQDNAAARCRVLTTDTEFYSFTRQANRIMQSSSRFVFDIVPTEPAETFVARLLEKAKQADHPYDAVYVSQITFKTQRCIVPDIPSFVKALREHVDSNTLIIVDGYHGFGAIPTDLSTVFQDFIYISGVLKHVGAGPNAAFAVIPSSLLSLRPLFTGWLADPSILSPGSPGVQMGSKVGYAQGSVLMGATPSFILPLLTFVAVMNRWAEGCRATLNRNEFDYSSFATAAHTRVISLQELFIQKLATSTKQNNYLNINTLLPLQPKEIRSHTLVFQQQSAADAGHCVETLAAKGIAIDCREQFVRIGFGFNHTAFEVDQLISAIKNF